VGGWLENGKNNRDIDYASIKHRFKIRMLTFPLLEHEPTGLDKLSELGRKIFGCRIRTIIT